ncbi:MAG: phage portal protein [Pseudomonadota bacterium]
MSQGNFLTKALAAGLGQIMSAVRAMRHPGQVIQFDRMLRRTRFDYQKEIGDGLDASVLLAPVFWMQRALPEATLALRETMPDGSIEDLDEHEMLALIQKPNTFYGDIALWGATVLSFILDGNAYWIKVRNAMGKPVELWWVPWWMIEPKAGLDGSAFISHYEYTPGTGQGRMVLSPDDVVHFRHGINPRNLIKGLSPIQGVIREIFTDLESSNFIASLLRNMGVPGVVISPRGSSMPVSDDVESTKAWFGQAFGGDNRGGPLVMGADTRVESFGFNPEQMNLRHGSDRAEERVCASIGIPAAVVGFGAGLQQTKVGATMEELRKLAWHNGVLPLGRQLVDELQRGLLPDFQRGQESRRKLKLYWNTEEVPALQEDEAKKSARKLKEYQAGAITLFEYRKETGRDADDSHRFYVRPFTQMTVPEGQAMEAGVIEGGANVIQDGDPPLDEEEEDDVKALPAPAARKDAKKPGRIAFEQKHGDDFLPADARPATEDEVVRGSGLIIRLERAEKGLRGAFEGRITPVFQGWGDEAARAAETVLRANGEKSGQLIETKAPDAELVQKVIDLLNLEAWDQQLSANYQQQYLQVATDVAEAIGESGYGTNLPDPVMREILADGGTRTGLIDLDDQTRAAIFDALAEGRAEGEGVTALANRIANQVEGGPWGNATTRARVIARTETKHAQNVSTIRAGTANGFSKFLVFDGRLGPGRSEPSHIARNGWIVSSEAAMTMATNMRPNCTLSFAPHNEL